MEYFCYKNLFDPENNSKVINDEFLTKSNHFTEQNFSANKETNEEKMEEFAGDNDL